MAEQLYKYPRTPHVEGSRFQPGDDDLDCAPFADLQGKYIVVEEKLDGATRASASAGTAGYCYKAEDIFLTAARASASSLSSKPGPRRVSKSCGNCWRIVTSFTVNGSMRSTRSFTTRCRITFSSSICWTPKRANFFQRIAVANCCGARRSSLRRFCGAGRRGQSSICNRSSR